MLMLSPEPRSQEMNTPSSSHPYGFLEAAGKALHKLPSEVRTPMGEVDKPKFTGTVRDNHYYHRHEPLQGEYSVGTPPPPPLTEEPDSSCSHMIAVPSVRSNALINLQSGGGSLDSRLSPLVPPPPPTQWYSPGQQQQSRQLQYLQQQQQRQQQADPRMYMMMMTQNHPGSFRLPQHQQALYCHPPADALPNVHDGQPAASKVRWALHRNVVVPAVQNSHEGIPVGDLWWPPQLKLYRKAIDQKNLDTQQDVQKYVLECQRTYMALLQRVFQYVASQPLRVSNNLPSKSSSSMHSQVSEEDDILVSRDEMVSLISEPIRVGLSQGCCRGIESGDSRKRVLTVVRNVLAVAHQDAEWATAEECQEETATVAQQLSLVDRHWARFLAIADEVVVLEGLVEA